MKADDTGIPGDPDWSGLARSFLSEDPGLASEAMRFGDYLLEEEVARGGMGIVYRARQLSLDRTVAVKVMREGAFAAGREVERFQQEAAAAAALGHPGIVPVFESGECEGRCFYAMEWIAGPNLAEVTRERPAPAKQAAQWMIEVAEAIQHAHGQGVIHRDLKPANVLLDPEARTRVTDFGMAQRADTASGLTLSGQTLGTPGYMAPEVAAGMARTAGAAADVYGLGALLFHLLTGRAPFIGESHATVLRQVIEAEPVSPRLLNASVPRDLETICLKALSREPARRFATAQAMAEDLARFLRGEPILARPVSAVARVWKWCRRQPALAASFAVVMLLGAGIVVTTLHSNRRIEGLRREAVERLYASDMRLALQNIAEGKYGAAAALVERHTPGKDGEDLRGFEWRLAREFCRSGERAALETMEGTVRAVAISPDGRWLAAAADNLRVWELRDDTPVVRGTRENRTRALAFAPDSRRLAVSFQGGAVEVFEVANLGAPQFSSQHSEDVAALAWRADGSGLEMITGSRQLRWSPGAGEPSVVAELPGIARQPVLSAGAAAAAFIHEPEGKEAYRFTVWGTAAARRLCSLPLAQDRILRSFGLSSDGHWLIAGDYSGRVTLRAAPFENETWSGTVHRGMVGGAAFSPDGSLVATCGEQAIRIMHRDSAGVEGWLRGHRSMVDAVALSPDNRHVLSGDESGAVKWWDAPARVKPEEVPVSSGVTASGDGGQLAWLWGPTGTLVLMPWGGAARLTRAEVGGEALAPSRSGCLLFPRSREGRTVRHVSLEGEVETITLPGPLEECSPDGRWVVFTAPERGLPVLHDLTGQCADRVLGDEPHPAAPAFSADGRLCCLGFRTGDASVIVTATGAEVCRLHAHRRWAYARGFSRDGKWLATAGFDGAARLWEVAGGKLVREFASSVGTLWCAALSPDGRRLAAGTGESTVILWDTATGLETGVIHLGLPQNLVENLAFTPDGAALIAHGHLLRAP